MHVDNDAAYCYRCRVVCAWLCFCASVEHDYSCAKTDEPIGRSFAVWTRFSFFESNQVEAGNDECLQDCRTISRIH